MSISKPTQKRHTSQRMKLAASMLLVTLVSACGGGGGSGAANEDEAEVFKQPQAVAGSVSVLKPDGSIETAPSGVRVKLVRLDSEGDPTTELGYTTTDALGKYYLPVPVEPVVGLSLGVVADEGAGGKWRAFVLHGDTEVGPGSEAAVREVLEASRRHSSAPAITSRLADFYRNASLALTLMDPPLGDPAAAVGWLQAQLRKDDAARSVLDELSRTNRIDEPVGDIGGLFGYARRAVEFNGNDGAKFIEVTSAAQGTAGEWIRTEHANYTAAGSNETRLRLQDDGVIQLHKRIEDFSANAILSLIGPHRIESFRLTTGSEQLLTEISTKTTGYDFSGDGVEDRLAYRVTQRLVGIETVQTFDQPMRALRIDSGVDLRIELSNGGAITVQSATKRWHAPVLGPVRSESRIDSTDRGGAVTSASRIATLSRAVVSGTSWPGRISVAVAPATIPPTYSFHNTLGLTADDQVVIEGSVGSGPYRGVAIRPLGPRNGVSTEILSEGGASGTLTVLSPDRTRLYRVLNKWASPGSTVATAALPTSEAAALGATIVRYDARTLVEEARFNLPPVASTLKPGLAFPRDLVRSMLISRDDPTHFIVASLDAVLVQGTEAAPLTVADPAAESLSDEDQPRMLRDSIRLLGWDAERDELRFEINGGGPLSRVVPITTDGLHQSLMRPSVPTMFHLAAHWSHFPLYSHVDSRFIYVGGFKQVHDANNGTLLGTLYQHPDWGLRGATCTLRSPDVACMGGEALYFLDPANLALRRKLTLHSDLRQLTGDWIPPRPEGGLITAGIYTASDGSLAYLGSTLFPAETLGYRLSFD